MQQKKCWKILDWLLVLADICHPYLVKFVIVQH